MPFDEWKLWAERMRIAMRNLSAALSRAELTHDLTDVNVALSVLQSRATESPD